LLSSFGYNETVQIEYLQETHLLPTHSLDESFGKAISFREPVVGANR
jgi:hypothetical protein